MTTTRRTTRTRGETRQTTNSFPAEDGSPAAAAETQPAPTVYELTAQEHALPLRRCGCCYSLMPRRLFKPVCIGCYAETERDQKHRRTRRADRHRID